jgi:hypothetical protein
LTPAIEKGEKMVYKNLSMKTPEAGPKGSRKFKTINLLALIVTLLFPSISWTAEISGPEILNILRQKDNVSVSEGYKVSFILTEQASRFSSKQGIVIEDCNATWISEGSFAMKITNYYEKEIPVFAPLGTEGYRSWDYDSNGNLIVWRDLESYILFTPERNDRIVNTRAYRIDPNGKLAKEGRIKKILHRYPIGSRGNIYEFDQFQLAMGRGFSKYLKNITAVESLSSGLVKVTAQELGSQSVPGGIWDITIDPNNDYIVREAIFTQEGFSKPTIVATSSGIIEKGGLKASKYGTYRYAILPEVSVEVTNISKVVGPNKLYEEVLIQMNSPLPLGTSIVDLRGDKPVRSIVE